METSAEHRYKRFLYWVARYMTQDGGRWLTCAQAAVLLGHVARTGMLRSSLVTRLINRLVDRDCLHLLLAQLTDTGPIEKGNHMADLQTRVGTIGLINPNRPEGRYVLKFSVPDERLVAEQLLRLQMESEETDSFPGLLKGQDDLPHNMLVDKKGKEKPLKANKEGKCIPEAWFTELPADGTWHCVYRGNNKTKKWSKLRSDIATKNGWVRKVAGELEELPDQQVTGARLLGAALWRHELQLMREALKGLREGVGFNINPVGMSEALLAVYTRVDEPEEGEDGEDDDN